MYTYEYPRPSVTADCVVITREETPRVLLIERGNPPFEGCWALPGGFMEMDESIEECAVRVLEEETGLKVSDTTLIGVYSKLGRDPRGRTVTAAYLAIIDKAVAATGQDDARRAQWFPINALPSLAFDHADIMLDAVQLFTSFLAEGLPPQGR